MLESSPVCKGGGRCTPAEVQRLLPADDPNILMLLPRRSSGGTPGGERRAALRKGVSRDGERKREDARRFGFRLLGRRDRVRQNVPRRPRAPQGRRRQSRDRGAALCDDRAGRRAARTCPEGHRPYRCVPRARLPGEGWGGARPHDRLRSRPRRGRLREGIGADRHALRTVKGVARARGDGRSPDRLDGGPPGRMVRRVQPVQRAEHLPALPDVHKRLDGRGDAQAAVSQGNGLRGWAEVDAGLRLARTRRDRRGVLGGGARPPHTPPPVGRRRPERLRGRGDGPGAGLRPEEASPGIHSRERLPLRARRRRTARPPARHGQRLPRAPLDHRGQHNPPRQLDRPRPGEGRLVRRTVRNLRAPRRSPQHHRRLRDLRNRGGRLRGRIAHRGEPDRAYRMAGHRAAAGVRGAEVPRGRQRPPPPQRLPTHHERGRDVAGRQEPQLPHHPEHLRRHRILPRRDDAGVLPRSGPDRREHLLGHPRHLLAPLPGGTPDTGRRRPRCRHLREHHRRPQFLRKGARPLRGVDAFEAVREDDRGLSRQGRRAGRALPQA